MSKETIFTLNTIKVIPTVEELENTSEYYCTEPSCAGVKFKNSANLELHRVKHHKLKPQEKVENREFHCPVRDCAYHIESSRGSHFSSKKYLKQHYQKVHASKVFQCTVCQKKFATTVLRDNHERTCGDYACPDCSYQYKSKEALLSHIRRKHNGNVSVSGLKRKRQKGVHHLNASTVSATTEIATQTNRPTATVNTETICPSVVIDNIEVGTQHDDPMDENRGPTGDSLAAQLIDNYCQTITGYFDDTFNCFTGNGANGAVSSIETQTELLDDLIQNSENLMSSIYSNDQHTQTCDAILSEMLVNDIETQTMWSGITADCNADMLVSTETQTGLFGGDNNSIQTQTIDAFLGSAPSTTTSSSFSSTHTQT